MSKASLLLLTNPQNISHEEDNFLAEYLSNFFKVTIGYPQDCETTEDTCDAIFIRNIGNTCIYKQTVEAALARFQKKRFKVYNSLDGSGDMAEKAYLSVLFEQGFSVVPSFDDPKKLYQLDGLEDCDEFLIKPLDGGDSIGIEKLNKDALMLRDLKGYLIQPFLNIEYEISFFFVDKVFMHALRTKGERWTLIEYVPISEELALAQRFADWNELSYGIQRVDFCKTKEGKLLLMEIEDYCPYLSLLDLTDDVKDRFLITILDSLCKNLGITIAR